jgi:hypothetical protein
MLYMRCPFIARRPSLADTGQGPAATAIRTDKAGVINCGPVDGYAEGEVRLFKGQNFFVLRVKDGFMACRPVFVSPLAPV